MKKFTLLIFSLLFTIVVLAQGHFTKNWSGNGTDQMSIYTYQATIGGINLEAGDEIAAFDGANCVGVYILTRPVDPGTFDTLIDFILCSKSDATPVNGFIPAHTISYKFWDSSKSKEISNVTALYIDTEGNPIDAITFEANGSAIVKLSAPTPENKVPVANAGADQTVNEGTTVTLDASASTDADNDALSYTWTAPAGVTLSSASAQKPTFTAPEVTADKTYTFSLIVNDGEVNSVANEVIITVKQVNKAPVANAGADKDANENTVVTLDGSASADADSDALTYTWTAPVEITLSSATVQKPTFTAPEVTADKTYTFSLIVNDGKENSVADEVIVTVKQVNKAPIANAAIDQTINEGATVTLDASASSDADTDPLTYTWTAPVEIALSSATAQKPTFTAPEVTADKTYTFSLIVNDGKENSVADEVIITVKQVNKAPIANAGADQTVDEGATVSLDGSASSDFDSDALTYIWTAPVGVTLSSATAQKPTFTAPEVATDKTYTISLIVNDGKENSIADEVVVTVKQVNKAPVANAGVDKDANENSLVTLDASASSDFDSDALTYQWTAPSGITLSSATAQEPTFTAPEVSADKTYTFSLIVNDGKVNSVADEIIVTVKQVNKAPVANAGADQTLNEGAIVALDGSASTDADNDVLTYSWTAPAGVTLSSATDQKPTFTAPEVHADKAYTFSLIVNDGKVNSVADEVIVTVKQINKAPIADAGPDQAVIENTTGTLDGTSSADPDNLDVLTYKWTAPAGITLSASNVAKPTFVAPEVASSTTYIFKLIVNDGIVDSPEDQVTITVKQENKVPVANAGINQNVNENLVFTLDGTGSSDPDADALAYKWTAPAGITLDADNIAKPSFTAPEVSADTDYTFTLIVNDGIANSLSDNVVVTVKQVNKAPVALAGIDGEVPERQAYQLDGSGSSDIDNDVLTFTWKAPAGITLSALDVAKPSFIAPSVNAKTLYTFELTVADGLLTSVIDYVDVYVNTTKAPVANAGADMVVAQKQIVSLDGSLSSDPDDDELTYQWTAPVGITLNDPTLKNPTFEAPMVIVDTDYTFKLKVNDGELDSNEDEVVVKVLENQFPIANAGTDFTVDELMNAMLDGSASSDPEDSTLTYKWTAPVEISLSSTTDAKPTFIAPEVAADTQFAINLVVNDGMNNSTADQVIVTVKHVNKAPVANAGINQAINEKTIVTLDGAASSDPDNDAITYRWQAPMGITLSSITDKKPVFLAPDVNADTEIKFILFVNDGKTDSPADQVIITVKKVNQMPNASAGTDRLVDENAIVTLDGAASSDPENDPLTYKWTAPAGITLSSATAQKPTFTAPEVATNTEYKFNLVVNDGMYNSSADEVVVTVLQVNKIPTASAGDNQSVNEETVVILDGSASSDPDNHPLTYKWTVPEGIVLSSDSDAKPTFTSPDVTSNTELKFTLVVNDGIIDSPADEVLVTVLKVNKVAVADAGSDQTINENLAVMLDGSASSDPDGDPLTYLWTAPAGITLSSLTAQNPGFTAPEVNADTQLTFSLVVNDGTANSSADQVVVTVKQVNKAPELTSQKSYTVTEDVPFESTITWKDVDADKVKVEAENLPQGLSLKLLTENSAQITGTLGNEYVGIHIIKLTLTDGTFVIEENVSITVENVDDAPYVKEAIKDISLPKRSPEQTIDLSSVFADDDLNDLITFKVTSNTNDKIVIATLSDEKMVLKFSTEYDGTSEITITAYSNDKSVTAKFKVELTIPVGFEPNYTDDTLSIYPNPSKGIVNIKFNNGEVIGTHFEIYDLTGRFIVRSLINSNPVQINLSDQPKGMYVVKVKNDQYKLSLQ